MKQQRSSRWRLSIWLYGLLFPWLGSTLASAQPSAKAISTFNLYIAAVESKLNQRHQSESLFLAPVNSELQLRRDEPLIEQLSPSNADLPGALLHHWRGTAFSPGSKATDFEQLMKNFSAYPQHFSPQVIQAKVLVHHGDQMQIVMRVRQQHILSVVMDQAYDVTFGRLDAQHGYSISRSTRISEIDSPGSASERTLSAQEDHGFLWRQNTYWSYEERDGGLYMQVESISLSRSIPIGLAWAIRPFTESIPRESLEFTLRRTCDALQK